MDQVVERFQFQIVQFLNNHDVYNTQIKITCIHTQGKFRRPCQAVIENHPLSALIPFPKFSYYYIFKNTLPQIGHVPLLANSLNHSLFFMWLYGYWMFEHCHCFSFFRQCVLDLVLVTLEIFVKK